MTTTEPTTDLDDMDTPVTRAIDGMVHQIADLDHRIDALELSRANLGGRLTALEQRYGVTPPVELPAAVLETSWDYDRTAKYYTRWGLVAGSLTGIVFGMGLGGWLA
jgi:hypothetical protein